MALKVALAASFLVFLNACSGAFRQAGTDLASNIADNVGCSNLKSAVFDSIYDYLEKTGEVPPMNGFADILESKLIAKATKQEDIERLRSVSAEISRALDFMTQSKKLPSKELVRFLIQIELGNQSTAEHIEVEEKVQAQFSKVNTLLRQLDLNCPRPTPPQPEPPPPVSQKLLTPAQFGGRFAFATAYQNCQVLDLPDVTSNTEDVKGVKKGANVGGGYARYYASISDIQRTHYYVRGLSYGEGCFKVKDKPLVYDFGGEPAVLKAGLDFFANAGSGGTALGLDCSAFISSSLAAAGLRYSPGIENKPIFVRQSSYDFIDPEKSGWKCFERVSMTPDVSLVNGDILAVKGHVVMVDHLGPDPFHLSKISDREQCSKISSSSFDFSILQSSPSKGSIGINRFVARDYLDGEPKVQAAFEAYARAACRAKFDGMPISVKSSEYGLIRHKGTPECLAPRLYLADQECISQCHDFK